MVQSETTAETQALACLEVWGGNDAVDAALVVPGLEVWIYAVPYGNAVSGGDVHFVSSCGTGRIARLMVADVSGHGEAVAETARQLRGLIRRYMNHIDQRQFVMRMNQRFTEMAQAGQFATAVALTYFSPIGELSVCNAGHPQPLIYRARTQTWDSLEAGESGPGDAVENIPLGILPEAGYQQFKTVLGRDDMILCYTDSLVESVCRDGSLLGEQRLLELVRGLAAGEGAHLIHHLLAKLPVHGAVLNDDVTLLLMRCTGPSRGAGFLGRLGAQLRFLGQALMFRPNTPWPEVSWKNLGGAVAGNRQREETTP